jgi:hypothetical protein
MKQLLIETKPLFIQPQSLTEAVSKSNGGNLFVEILLATVEVKNGNGRYYSKELWQREIDKFNTKIQNRTTETVGELDHPDSTIINLKNGSHAIRKIWWDNDNIMGIIEIFCDSDGRGTSSGRIAGAYIKNGLTMGISSRGMGSLKQVGEIMEVQDDFELLTWDLVSNPSNPGSWSNNSTAIQESKNIKLKSNKYENINSILTEILCSQGTCPIW